MSDEMKWQYDPEEYIRQGEPGRVEKSKAWQTAIGLQAVDGLKTSEYFWIPPRSISRVISLSTRRRSIFRTIMDSVMCA